MDLQKDYLQYTPDDDLKVHSEGAIKLLCSDFQSHENGIPEWIKNSSDEYLRNEVPQNLRVIVLNFQDGRGENRPASISCLDFCGMSSDVIDNRFRIWADPDAASRGQTVQGLQGGHGNGGKCYMTQMFELYSGLLTCLNGQGNRYGVAGGSVKFGYFPDKATGRNYVVQDLKKELDKVLSRVGLSVARLPNHAREALGESKGFTLATGIGPKGIKSKIKINRLVDSLVENPMMVISLETCSIYVMHNGVVLNYGRALRIATIPPMPGATKPREIVIPETLLDPENGEEIPTKKGARAKDGVLRLFTSDSSMRRTLKGRHLVSYRSSKGFLGYKEVTALDVQSPFVDRIYGECILDALEDFKQNSRRHLAPSPLTRAVESFIGEQIQQYAEEFEAQQRREYDQQAKNEISRMNEALDQWKNRFLSEMLSATWGSGKGEGDDDGEPLPKGIPSRIVVGLSHTRMGVGVPARPKLRFFDKSGQRIRAVPYTWVSDNPEVIEIDQKLNMVVSKETGQAVIHVETSDGAVRSNLVPIEVVDISEIRLSPAECSISSGGHFRLIAICQLKDGSQASDVMLIWTEDDPEVVRVSAGGMAFGGSPGTTNVIAADDRIYAKQPIRVTVTESTGKDTGKEPGKGFPKVLVSGEIDQDPDSKEFVHFSSEDPPIAQRPQDADRNIWWINSAAPLAKLYLDEKQSYGYKTQAWRMYHVERYIDVITQIALEQNPELAGNVSVQDVLLNWGSTVAEVQGAAAADLVSCIGSGALPAKVQ